MKKLSILARLYGNILATILILFISVGAMFYTLDTLEKLEVIFKYYHQTFLTIELDIFEMGFKDWGKMGERREAVHNVENIIDEHNLKPVYMVEMLMLRRHEKDFIIRKDLKYQQKLNDRIATFKETLEQDEEILEDKKRQGV